MDNGESMKMPYELLKEITHDFSQQLGCGTYGVVYKGTNANGREVAVKVFRDMAALDDKEFTNEFQTLAKLDHKNIVQLVGYCSESKPVVVEHDGKQITAEKLHLALCFEYINNGSLGDHITDEKQGLHWHIRYKIIKGICEGLNYLHKGLQEPILHLDLKPGNILLDKEMVPKIADFGLSRLIGDERTKQTMNKSVGTRGYLPPEYMKFQLLSPAFDIFSLGIIITKIMVGRERYNDIADMPPQRLVELVHTSWKNRLQEIEGFRSRLEVYCQQVNTCIEVASKCLMEDRHQRPTIQQIVATLTEAEMVHSIPSRQIQENEVSMRMLKADPQDATSIFNLHKDAKDNVTDLSRKEIKSLTQTYIGDTSLVAILLATTTFAAAFTLPGGYSTDVGNEGPPIMVMKFAFKAFLVSDTLAVCSSLAVAITCVIAWWEDLEFLLYYRSFIKKRMWFACMATITAFAAGGLYTVMARRLPTIAVCILTSLLPIITKLLGEWPILRLRFRLGRTFRSELLGFLFFMFKI